MKKITKTVLNTVSKVEIDITKNYELQRKITNLAHFHILKFLHKSIDAEIKVKRHFVPLRIFFPKEQNCNHLIIYFHGGGFVDGNIDSYNKTCAILAETTKQYVASIDYRLAPEYPFPKGLEDCYCATKEFFMNSGILNVPKENITLMGDSAGGNLAAVVSLMARDKKEFQVTKQILIYPLTYHDHSDTSPFASIQENGSDWILTNKRINEYIKLYIKKKKDLENPYFAPLLMKDLSNQPDTLIITAALDPLRDEGEAYGKRLKEAGNHVTIRRIEDTIHGFFTLSFIPKPLNESYLYINQFLNGDEFIEK